MVEAFVGLVGGGKSYSSVRRMCNYIASGGIVVTNILFTGFDTDTGEFANDSPVLSYLRSKFSWEYQQGQYIYIPFEEMCSLPAWFKRVPGGQSRNKRTFLCIDEATDLFDTLDRGKLANDSVYRELFRFLRLSRHAHIDVLFICQDLNAINSRLRGLVSFIWRSTDMSNFRVGGLRVAIPLNCFLLQQFDRTGKLELKREFVAKEQAVFALYQSEAFHDSMGITFADQVKDGKIKRGRKMSKFQLFLFYFVVFGLGYCIYNSFKLDKRLETLSKLVKQDERQKDIFASSVPVKENVVSVPEEKKPSRRVVRGVFDFVGTNSGNYCFVDGDLYRVGMLTEFGLCKVVTKNSIVCVDGLAETVILPRAPVPASAGSFQGVRDGARDDASL